MNSSSVMPDSDNDVLAVGMATVHCADPASLAAFWSAAVGQPIVADHGGFVMVGGTPGLGFEQVDEPEAGTNRMHLDLRCADRAAAVRRLVGQGAHEQETHAVPGLTWTVMTDPEGNVFCVGQLDS